MEKFIAIAAFLALPLIGSSAPEISNVRASQRLGTKLVDVYYTLKDADGTTVVGVAVSSDGGTTYSIPALNLTGDVGSGVVNGFNKHVVWDAGVDWNEQFSQAVKFRVTAINLDGFVLIPAGSFQMGHPFNEELDNDILPFVRSVHVSAYYIAEHEVTKALWDEVRTWGASNGYTDLPTGGGKAANHPVHSISWYDIVKWCNARSQREGLTVCYSVSGATYKKGRSDAVVCNWNGSGYRLPTEAEWEKAARGGQSGLRYPWGNVITHSEANYYSHGFDDSFDKSPTFGFHPSFNDGIMPYTSPVASFAANGYGLHDMAGNVLEMCWDWYAGFYYDTVDPRGPSLGTYRVSRGGCWRHNDLGCYAACRNYYEPGAANNCFGFRPARSSVP